MSRDSEKVTHLDDERDDDGYLPGSPLAYDTSSHFSDVKNDLEHERDREFKDAATHTLQGAGPNQGSRGDR